MPRPPKPPGGKPAMKQVIIEQKAAEAIVSVLRDTVAHVAAARRDVHHMHHKIEEIEMKVSELSGKVDTLITVAMDIKAAALNASQVTATQEDDPQVADIATRIDNAVAALQGAGAAIPQTPATPPSTPPDAPVPPAPVQDPTALNPQPVDPNAPV